MPPVSRQPAAEQSAPQHERTDFPLVGARARRWGRFERDLSAWLASPEGRFAAWRARQARAEGLSARSPR